MTNTVKVVPRSGGEEKQSLVTRTTVTYFQEGITPATSIDRTTCNSRMRLWWQQTVVSWWLDQLKRTKTSPKIWVIDGGSRFPTVLDLKRECLKAFQLTAASAAGNGARVTPAELDSYTLVWQQVPGGSPDRVLRDQDVFDPGKHVHILLTPSTPATFCRSAMQRSNPIMQYFPPSGDALRESVLQSGSCRHRCQAKNGLLGAHLQVHVRMAWFDCHVISDPVLSNPVQADGKVDVQFADGLVVEGVLLNGPNCRSPPKPTFGYKFVAALVFVFVMCFAAFAVLRAMQRGVCLDFCFAGIGYSSVNVIFGEWGFNRTADSAFECAFGDGNVSLVDPVCLVVPPETVASFARKPLFLSIPMISLLFFQSWEFESPPKMLYAAYIFLIMAWMVEYGEASSAAKIVGYSLACIVLGFLLFGPAFSTGRAAFRGASPTATREVLRISSRLVAAFVLTILVLWVAVFHATSLIAEHRSWALAHPDEFNATISDDGYLRAVYRAEQNLVLTDDITSLAVHAVMIAVVVASDHWLSENPTLLWVEVLLLIFFCARAVFFAVAILPMYPDMFYHEAAIDQPEWSATWWAGKFGMFFPDGLYGCGVAWLGLSIIINLSKMADYSLSLRRLATRVRKVGADEFRAVAKMAGYAHRETFQPLHSHPTVSAMKAACAPMEAALSSSRSLTSLERGHIAHLCATMLKFIAQAQKGMTATPEQQAALQQVITEKRTVHRTMYVAKMVAIAQDPSFWPTVDHAQRAERKIKMLRRVSLQKLASTNDVISQITATLESAKGVYPFFNELGATIAKKAAAEFHPARMKGLYRICEKLRLVLYPEEVVSKHGASRTGDSASGETAPETKSNANAAVFRRTSSTTKLLQGAVELQLDEAAAASAARRVCDVVRGMIVCSNMSQMLSALDLLLSLDAELASLLDKFEVDGVPCMTSPGHVCNERDCKWVRSVLDLTKDEEFQTNVSDIFVNGNVVTVLGTRGRDMSVGDIAKLVLTAAGAESVSSWSTGKVVATAPKQESNKLVDGPASGTGRRLQEAVQRSTDGLDDVLSLSQLVTTSAAASGRARRVRVERMKNRLYSPTSGGWADLCVSISFPDAAPNVM